MLSGTISLSSLPPPLLPPPPPLHHTHAGATIAEIQRQTGVIIKTSDRNAGDAVNRTVNLTGTVPAQQMALQLVQQAIASDAGALTAFVASQTTPGSLAAILLGHRA